MSLSYLTQFPVESITLNIIAVFYVVLLMAEFINILVLHWVGGEEEFCSKSDSIDDSEARVEEKNQDLELPCSSKNKEENENISGGDVEVVMERLGIFCHSDDEKLQEKLGSDDLLTLFEEKEPSLDEVKGAFDVFDENRDGLIDSNELQRVLFVLGFKEGERMESCRRMIGLFDENGDGRIDFGEFVKMMESSFC